MSVQGLNDAIARMRADGMSDVAITAFTHNYHQWESDRSGFIAEENVKPLKQLPSIAEVMTTISAEDAHEALAHTAFLKLNGGLGTSMGLSKAKSLLPVRLHKGRPMRFLDIILGQVVATRSAQGVDLPLVFMNSYRTSKDTLQVIRRNRHFKQTGIPVEILQHREPKILAKTGEPVSWPENLDLEWCPPGHGDVYATLSDSGILDTLEKAGIRYLFISNSDNLGARPSSSVAGYFAQTDAPFMVEVARKTQADVKGGQFVFDKTTGTIRLREMSQVPKADLAKATDIKRHPFFNTNNIWVRIDALKAKLAEYNGILPLPVIRNTKTVDPTNPDSPQVVQLETAMGAAIGLFEGSVCLEVNRPRFLPVKTTNDLFIMRSDRFHLTDTFEMEDGNYDFPKIHLDPRYYKLIQDFDERFPYGVPSIAAANSVTIEGDWTFGASVKFFGDAHLADPQNDPDPVTRRDRAYVRDASHVGPRGIEKGDW